MLLTVVAAVAAERVGWRRPAAVVLVAATVVTSAAGVAWHVQRTRVVAGAFDDLAALTGDAVVLTTSDHLYREGGGSVVDQRWLLADRRELGGALDVAQAMGAGAVVVVETDRDGIYRPPALAGLVPGETARVPWEAGRELVVTPYQRFDAAP